MSKERGAVLRGTLLTPCSGILDQPFLQPVSFTLNRAGRTLHRQDVSYHVPATKMHEKAEAVAADGGFGLSEATLPRGVGRLIFERALPCKLVTTRGFTSLHPCRQARRYN